jgi:hypothetical protein
VRVFGQPQAQEHARTHTCTCIRHEQTETLSLCGRLAGVPDRGGVQREHRRVEHSGRDVNDLRKRRFGRRMQRGEVMRSVGL